MRKCWFRGDYPCNLRNCCCCPFVWLTCGCCKDTMYETHPEFEKKTRKRLEKQIAETKKGTDLALTTAVQNDSSVLSSPVQPVVIVSPQ
jgi:hypothetical protein